MTTKEHVLEALHALGFETKMLDGDTYGIHYEGDLLLCRFNEEDAGFFGLYYCMPIGDEEAQWPVLLANQINASRNYVKAYRSELALWLAYEREMFEKEEWQVTVSRMIEFVSTAVADVKQAFLECAAQVENVHVTDSNLQEA